MLFLLIGCNSIYEPHSPSLLKGGSSSVSLLIDGQEFVDSLKASIDRANESIYIEIYEFRSDSVGRDVMSHLLAKAKDGVSVKIVLDGWGSAGQWNFDSLSGIDISEWDSFQFPYVNHVLSRNHRKVVIIDDNECMVGCTNIADYYIDGLPELGCWHDMTLMFPADSLSPSFEIVKNRGEILTRWIHLLDSAKESVKIINPYIAPPSELEAALSSAINRGVDVTFLFSEKGDIDSYYRSSKSFLSRIGGNVWVYPGGFHHTKAMSIDGRVLFIGSANMTHRALNRNLEENVVVQNKDVVEKFDSVFNEYVQSSYPFDCDSVSFIDKLYDRLSFLIID